MTPEELLSITAPLKPLEHCTGPFLEKCDENDNGIITLTEWGMCLGLEEGRLESCSKFNRTRNSETVCTNAMAF